MQSCLLSKKAVSNLLKRMLFIHSKKVSGGFGSYVLALFFLQVLWVDKSTLAFDLRLVFWMAEKILLNFT